MAEKDILVTNDTLGKVVKGAGELAIPGLSLILNKQYKSGLLHTLGALVAGAIMGPVGYVLVAADSFSTAETGATLIDRFASKPLTPAVAARKAN